jgi:WD40 repeat protein
MMKEENFFHPESVDEEIEQTGLPMGKQSEHLKYPPTAHNESKEQLVNSLHDIYRQQAKVNEHELETAWQQIQASNQYRERFKQEDKKQEEYSINMQGVQPKTADRQSRRRRETPPTAESTVKHTLSMLAAVLLIGAIVGSMALIINAARHTTTIGTGSSISGKVVFTYHDTASDTITAVSWSKDGSRLLSAGTTIQVWNIHNKKFPGHQTNDNTTLFNAKWSPDGKMIADTIASGVEIWNTATGQTLRTCPTPVLQSSIALSDLSSAQSTTQKVVPLSYSIPLQPQSMGLITTINVAWSPDGKYIAATVGTPTSGGVGLVVYDSSNCTIVWQPIPRSSINMHVVSDVTWSPDGKYLAWAVEDKVEVQEFTNRHHIYTYKNEPVPAAPNAISTIDKVLWSPDGQRIITVDSIGRIAVWDALTGRHKISYTGHKLVISGVAWSPDSQYIVSGAFVNGQNGGQGEMRVWNAQNGRTIYISPDHRPNFAVSWSPDGKYIAVAYGKYSTIAPPVGQGRATVSVLKAEYAS